MRLLIAFATTVSMSAAAAAEPAELYQLQLQCEKNAAEVLQRTTATERTTDTLSTTKLTTTPI